MIFNIVSWRAHVRFVSTGERNSLRDNLGKRILGALGQQDRYLEENFSSGGDSRIVDLLVDQYFEKLTGAPAKIVESMDAMTNLDKREIDERRLFHLQMEFLKMAEQGAVGPVQEAITQYIDVNFQDPETGMTALHFAACGDEELVQLLDETGDCNWLIQDCYGRVPYDMAMEFAPSREFVKKILGYSSRQASESEYESFVDYHRAHFQPD